MRSPPRRKLLRLKNYNYSQPGFYFITICTYQRMPLFGAIEDDQMNLSLYGRIAKEEWEKIAKLNAVSLDVFTMMPNHLHGIIVLEDQSSDERKKKFIPDIVAAYKAGVSRKINRCLKEKTIQIWQRNYYEHIVRHERALEEIRNYIIYNPQNWQKDELFV